MALLSEKEAVASLETARNTLRQKQQDEKSVNKGIGVVIFFPTLGALTVVSREQGGAGAD